MKNFCFIFTNLIIAKTNQDLQNEQKNPQALSPKKRNQLLALEKMTRMIK